MKSILFLCLSLFIVNAAFAKDKVCEPGTPFKNDCNICWCGSDGTAETCTEMACPTIPEDKLERRMVETVRVDKKCEPNSHFKDKCNDCLCNKDGTMAACTLKSC